MMKKSVLGLAVLLPVIANAQPIAIAKDNITASAIISNPKLAQGETTKPVVLMNVQLTPEQYTKFVNVKMQNGFALSAIDSKLPSSVNLGMNNVPVLDQGQHGTCVTFANTAALDAVIGKGDYASQLCSLELGSFLERYGFYPSGWDGSWGPWILNQLEEFGIVTTAMQTSKGCSGVTEYPTDDPYNRGSLMTATDYHNMSQNIQRSVTWDPIMTMNERLGWTQDATPHKMDRVLNHVKRELAVTAETTPLRVTFGTLIPVRYCSVGACGTYHAKYDTWAITDTIAKDKHPSFGGHEMVIIGYDDNAVATDNEGKQHKGLLILRNSWGTVAGDNGNYYMTYDFFKTYALEVQRVMKPLE